MTSYKTIGRSDSRKSRKQKKFPVSAVLMVLLFSLTVAFTCSASMGNLTGLADSAALLSARLSLPLGGEQVVQSNLSGIQKIFGSGRSPVSAVASTSSSGTPSSGTSSAAVPAGDKPVVTVQFGAQSGGGYESYAGVTVDNTTASGKADIQNQLSLKPDFKINLKSSPQVLIIHTHTTEAYASSEKNYYDPEDSGRSLDKTKSVVRVGDEIEKYLKENGIGVVHDTTVNDYPEYSGAYSRSLSLVEKELKQYPSIKVVLDIHREPIQYDDGTRVRTTAVISGKKAAQILLVVGDGEQNSSLTVPAWIQNYRFALRIEQQLNKSWPGLARPISLVDKQYNEQASHGALLVQIGTDVNTLDEAVYSGQLFGKSLSQVLKSLQS